MKYLRTTRKVLPFLIMTFLLVCQTAAQTDPCGPPPSGSIGTPEENYWNSIKNSSTAKDFEDYLNIFPSGRCAAAARQRVNEINNPRSTTPPSNSSSPEDQFWNAIKNSTNPADFQTYLRAFPNGRFASIARQKSGGSISVSTAVTIPPFTATLSAHRSYNSDEMVQASRFSPDGRMIASGGWNNKLKLWNALSGASIWEVSLQGSGDLILDLAFSPDGRRIVTGSRQSDRSRGTTVKIWDANTGAPSLILQGAPSEFCDSVAFSPDGTRIAAGCFNQTTANRTIHIWDSRNGSRLLTIKDFNGPVKFSPDSSRITGGHGYSNVLKFWDLRSGGEIQSIDGSADQGAAAVDFSPDGSRIATGNRNGTVKVYDVNSGKEVLTLRGHSKRVIDVAFSPDGTMIASGSDEGSLFVWHAGSGVRLAVLKFAKDVQSVAFSPDGNWLVNAGGEGINIWQVNKSR